MIRPTPAARAQLKLRVVLGAVVALFFNAPAAVNAQGLVKGVQEGAKEGNKAAGPVGGVLGGAIGGVVGVFTGVLGVGGKNEPAPAAGSKQAPGSAKNAKTAQAPKGAKQTAGVTPGSTPPTTAQQIGSRTQAKHHQDKTALQPAP